MEKKTTKAVALLSGGLDSILAARIIMEQNIEVICLYFSSPFWSNSEKEEKFLKKVKTENGFDIKIIQVGDEYIDIIKNPKYGWGKGINPCVDCKIFMLKKAKKVMEEIGASFLITGEIIGQRPMSQHKSALNYIEKHADVKGILVRPLCGKLLPITKPEENGLIKRENLLGITGRSRKIQNMLAKKYNIKTFSSPAGGCLLTQEVYAKKLRDLFNHNEGNTMEEIELLNYGRHFRYNKCKIIVGRNKKENEYLKSKKNMGVYIIELDDNIPGPVTLLLGEDNREALDFAIQLTLLYSDLVEKKANVKIEKNCEIFKVEAICNLTKNQCSKYNIAFI